jgi:hypothetical protein
MFFTDFLPTMQGPYTPNLGPFGARPDNFMHLPVSDFSEKCDPMYGPPAQFGSERAIYNGPKSPPILHVQSATAYPAAIVAYAPEASPQPPPAGSHSGDHAHNTSTSVVQPARTPAPRRLFM